ETLIAVSEDLRINVGKAFIREVTSVAGYNPVETRCGQIPELQNLNGNKQKQWKGKRQDA
ncbi:MAG: hypothetical protein KKA41_06845, partial [Proteobacteria bacterium]|nr:hypothetical protein [Pseudomonadota bacterium]